MDNEDLKGRDQPDHPADTCLWTGQTFSELDHYNVGTDEHDKWMPFVSESAYLAWMADAGRSIPALQS